jgi:hypothetical protein
MTTAREPLLIVIDPESELGQALAAVDDAPLVLARGGDRFRVIREVDTLWADYDPERVRRALRESAGALAGVDVAALKRELRAQRQQDSSGRPAYEWPICSTAMSQSTTWPTMVPRSGC